jgi:hypothetical protein
MTLLVKYPKITLLVRYPSSLTSQSYICELDWDMGAVTIPSSSPYCVSIVNLRLFQVEKWACLCFSIIEVDGWQ